MKYSGVNQTPTAAPTIHVMATRLLRYKSLKTFLFNSMKNKFNNDIIITTFPCNALALLGKVNFPSKCMSESHFVSESRFEIGCSVY